jgi:hypothetical protein
MIEPGQERGEEPRLDAETVSDLEPREEDAAGLKGGRGPGCQTGGSCPGTNVAKK